MTLNTRASFAAGVASLLAVLGAAEANPYVDKLLIHDGKNAGLTNRDVNGQDLPRDQVYPGSEQSVAVQLMDGKIMVVSMSSYTDVNDFNGKKLNEVLINGTPTNTRMQGLCTVVDIGEGGLTTAVAPVHITANRGDQYRNFNHPNAVTLENGNVLVIFNYADNNNNDAERTGLILSPTCARLSAETQIFGNLEATGDNNNNDNFCETDGQNSLTVVSDSGNTTVFAEGCGGNGNGTDDSWLYTASVNPAAGGAPFPYTLSFKARVRTTAQEERSRPSIALISDRETADSVFAVTSYTKGNTQPPDQGVWVVGTQINKTTGAITPVFNKVIDDYADIEPGVLSTQIRMTPVNLSDTGSMLAHRSAAGGDMLYATWQRVNAQRRRGKGKAALMGAALRITEDDVQLVNLPQQQLYADGDATHMHMFSAPIGVAGSETTKAFLISSSVNGSNSALSSAKSMTFDGSSLVADRKYNLNTAMDNAWLSNIYGNNPNTQGRNFVSAGTAVNPWYGQTAGYQTDVQQFIVLASNTRRIDPMTGINEDKLALELVLVPSVTAPGAEQVGTPTNPEKPGGDDVAGGCSVQGEAGFSTLALLGLALLGIRRRRA